MALAISGIIASPGFAWHDVGHRTIAILAWKAVPSHQDRISDLLKYMPDRETPRDSFALPNPMNEKLGPVTGSPSLTPALLDDAAVWPDKIRNSWMDRPVWHYVNYPVLGPAGVAPATVGGLAERVLPLLVNICRDKQQSKVTRATALAWVAHIVGDLHMPLHSVAYFDAKHPTGDRGGNDYFLNQDGTVYKDKDLNLHSYWDSIGNQNEIGVTGVLDRLPKAQFDTPKYSLATIGKEVRSWCDAGKSMAEQHVYKFGGDWLDPYARKFPIGYEAVVREKGLAQIQLAGARLAAVLQLIFAD